MRDLGAARARRGDDGARPDLTPHAATFLRGLSLGVLVGAAIAGSAIWRRLRDAREEPAVGSPGETVAEPGDSA